MAAPRLSVFLLTLYSQVLVLGAVTNPQEFAALKSLKHHWRKTPANWVGDDPCGSSWEGIRCDTSSVTSIVLSGIGLRGKLPADIQNLPELRTLDLSQNKGLSGTLPPSIGNLTKLENLLLTGCSFHGLIPDTLGSLTKLKNLNLNSNSFSGPIPASIGNLSKLILLDLTDNQLNGTIPVSNETSPGLDGLVNALHFHFGRNQLTGPVPLSLFSSKMALMHVLFDNNNFTGSIPTSLEQLQNLQVIRMDKNSFNGTVSFNFTSFPNITTIYLSNNQLTGPLPNLTGLSNLSYVDMSNNSFEGSTIPPGFSSLQSLTTLVMENTNLQGPIPVELFRLPQLESVILKNNQLNESLDIGTSYGRQLHLIDVQNNSIESLNVTGYNKNLNLQNNPICEHLVEKNCSAPQVPSSSRSTPPNNCEPNCSNSPITGILIFRTFSFSNWDNTSYYIFLRDKFMDSFKASNLPVDSMSVTFRFLTGNDYLELDVKVFPYGNNRFNTTTFSMIISQLNNITFVSLSPNYGPSYYINIINYFIEEKSQIWIIIGATAGGFILLVLLLIAGMYAIRQRKKARRATQLNDPFASWEPNDTTTGPPKINGPSRFSFIELKKCTNNFSDTNILGTGGYGQVYKGMLETGLEVAIKRAKQGSLQGRKEFKSEIEILSRAHHKNVVSLVGYCYEQGEQMLVYEFIHNGTLKDSLSGKSGIRLSWTQRLRIAIDSARGLAYLHDHTNPSIIHRDIKSNNILLNDHLTAKVADFGLSKTLDGREDSRVTTNVKGTRGYLDPEYSRTYQLTKKSDVYSFGVVMLELLTGRSPIERGRYIVSELEKAMDRTEDLYNLHMFIDPVMNQDTLSGLENFVDLAMRCVEDLGANRPTMREVVKKFEDILWLADSEPQSERSVFSISFT